MAKNKELKAFQLILLVFLEEDLVSNNHQNDNRQDLELRRCIDVQLVLKRHRMPRLQRTLKMDLY